MLDLGPDELFVVGALRAWVAPLMRPGSQHPDWRSLFGIAGVAAPGAAGFDLMLTVIAGSAQRLLEVRCCRCPTLGADEAAMLHLVSALQIGDVPGALDVLSDWLPPDSVPAALRAARHFAAAMAAGGLRVSLQPHDGRPAAGAGRVLH